MATGALIYREKEEKRADRKKSIKHFFFSFIFLFVSEHEFNEIEKLASFQHARIIFFFEERRNCCDLWVTENKCDIFVAYERPNRERIETLKIDKSTEGERARGK